MRQLQAESLEYVVKNLRARLDDPSYRTEHVSSLMVQVQRDLRRVKRIGRDIGTVARVEDKATEVRRAGFLIELEHIQLMYESGRINRHTHDAARARRQGVGEGPGGRLGSGCSRRPQLATASRLKALRYVLASPCSTLDEERV